MNEMLPGHDLIIAGLEDIANRRQTVESLLVSIGAPKLRLLGFSLPDDLVKDPEHKL